MEKILITSDSTTDLGPELIEKYNIVILPLSVTLCEKNYTDGVDINPDIIYAEYEKSGQLPKTAAPNLADCQDFFAKYKKEGYSVVHFALSSQMSSSFSNARLAAEDFDDVFVVDTKNLSTGGGLLVMAAASMREKGLSAKEIAEKCTVLADKVDASFIIDNLEFLHKGGRCSAISMLGANLLQLKPCIVVTDGKMSVGKKYRGNFQRVLGQYIAERLASPENVEQDCVFVTHAGCADNIVEDCRKKVAEILPDANIYTTRAGCTISSHCGRNTLGVLFIKK